MKKQRGKGQKNDGRSFLFKSILWSVLFGAGVCALLMCGFAVALSLYDLPLGIVQPLAVFSLVAGCMAAGYLCARKNGQRGMVYGGVCGGVLFLCLALAQGLCRGPLFAGAMLPKAAMMLTSGMIGGIFGVNKR